MADAVGRAWRQMRLEEVLDTHPGLRIVPTTDADRICLRGILCFDAELVGAGTIRDAFPIAMDIPLAFPKLLPTVRELSGRVTRDYHTNPDGTLCLGSPVRLHLALAAETSPLGFINRCVIPFLAGHSYLAQMGKEWTPALAHGDEGLLDDYQALFGVRSAQACVQMMALLGQRKRVANKHECPCSSGRRVGRCHHRVLNSLRSRLGRPWWQREHARWLHGCRRRLE